jgi:hypothetical protein
MMQESEQRITDMLLSFRTEVLQAISQKSTKAPRNVCALPLQAVSVNCEVESRQGHQAPKAPTRMGVRVIGGSRIHRKSISSKKSNRQPRTTVRSVQVMAKKVDAAVQAAPPREVAVVQTEPQDQLPALGLLPISDRDSEASDSEPDEYPVRAFAAVAGEAPAGRKRTRRTEPVAEELKQAYLKKIEESQTIAELREDLKKLQEEVRQQKKETKTLTEEETNLLKKELLRKLAHENWDEKHEPRLQAMGEGGLDDEEKKMGRKQLLRRLQQEEHAAWMQAQEEEGKAYTCQRCGRRTAHGDQNHQCFQTSYRGPQRKKGGVWVRDQMYVAQAGRGNLQVGVRPVMDQDRVEKELQRMTAALQKQQQHTRPVPVPQQVTPDVQMQPSSSAQQVAEVQQLGVATPQVGVVQPYQMVQAMPAQPFLQQGPMIAQMG